MGNNLNITITAADKATKVFRQVNKSMNGMLAPAKRLRQAAKSISTEAFANPLVQGIYKVGKASIFGAKQAVSFVEPFTALAGVGTIAGVAALADSMGRAGQQTYFTARRINGSVGQLQLFRGAARAAGLSAEDMDSSLVTLSETLQDVQFNRNREAQYVLGNLGIQIKRDKNGIVDTAAAMNDLADAIQRTATPQTQALIAKTFGLEQLLPILQNGSSGLRRYMALAQQMGAVDEEAAAKNKKLGESFNVLGLAISALENRAAKSWMGDAVNATVLGWADIISGGKVLAGKPAPMPAPGRTSSGKIKYPSSLAKPLGIPNLREQVYEQIHGKPMPLGLRQNNPGNLRSWGDTPSQNGYAAFATPQLGLRAMAKQLEIYGERGNDTLGGIISTYAPKSDGNDTEGYIADVSRRTGFDPNQRLNLRDQKTLAPLLSAMIQHEQGIQPFGAQEITEAITAAIDNNTRAVADAVKSAISSMQLRVEAPAGSKVTQKNGTSQSMRVAQSMPAIP